ncbi:MAG: hypothetical protein M1383_02095 [Patescibacteria group bacterium]|nr:hypothetical protein [Patescibacteria group bacterium]
MGTISTKNKIFIALAVWLIACASMFGYFFNILSHSNGILLSDIKSKNKEKEVLANEQDSYLTAKKDVETLRGKAVQPEDFFSKDVALVEEIRTLENLGERLGVKFSLSGISGTVGSAPKAPTVSSIASVPYSLSISGDFTSATAFIESLEHLSFVTYPRDLSVTSGGSGTVNVSLTANFYLQKP